MTAPVRFETVPQSEVSRSAVNVALTRTHLTWLGVVDDPHAWPMLPARVRRLATAFRLPGIRQAIHRHPSFPYLAARTLCFDRFARDALDGVPDEMLAAGLRPDAPVAFTMEGPHDPGSGSRAPRRDAVRRHDAVRPQLHRDRHQPGRGRDPVKS
jgi:O-methyltransferase involved in polyketide biosynthesis